MARDSKEFKIDGVRYVFTPYNVVHGTKLSIKLLKIFGRPLGIVVGDVIESNADLFRAIGEGASNIRLTREGIGQVVGSLVDNLDPNEVETLLNEIFDGSTIYLSDGKNMPIDVNRDFGLGMGHLWKVVKEALFFQFDFLGNAVSSVAQEVTKAVRRVQAK